MIESDDNSRYHRFLRLFSHLSLFDHSSDYKRIKDRILLEENFD